jgi:hypothetical protein
MSTVILVVELWYSFEAATATAMAMAIHTFVCVQSGIGDFKSLREMKRKGHGVQSDLLGCPPFGGSVQGSGSSQH